MAMKYKKTDWDKIGYWKQKGYTPHNSVPKGFYVYNQSNLPVPIGYRWYWNQKSMFAENPKNRFKRILVRIK